MPLDKHFRTSPHNFYDLTFAKRKHVRKRRRGKDESEK